MKLFYMSDNHLEFLSNEILFNEKLKDLNPEKEDVLILAGDVTLLIKKNNDILKKLLNKFSKYYYIAGNHEFYNSKISLDQILENDLIYNNVNIVNNKAIEISNEYVLILSTLFTKLNPTDYFFIKNCINDFKLIKYKDHILSLNDWNEFYEKPFDFIKNYVEQYKDKKLIIVSHHVPTYFKTVNSRFAGSLSNQLFTNELYDFIFDNENIKYWIYGHNHNNVNDFEIGNCKLLTNQFGYIDSEDTKLNFDINKFIEI